MPLRGVGMIATPAPGEINVNEGGLRTCDASSSSSTSSARGGGGGGGGSGGSVNGSAGEDLAEEVEPLGDGETLGVTPPPLLSTATLGNGESASFHSWARRELLCLGEDVLLGLLGDLPPLEEVFVRRIATRDGARRWLRVRWRMAAHPSAMRERATPSPTTAPMPIDDG